MSHIELETRKICRNYAFRLYFTENRYVSIRLL